MTGRWMMNACWRDRVVCIPFNIWRMGNELPCPFTILLTWGGGGGKGDGKKESVIIHIPHFHPLSIDLRL